MDFKKQVSELKIVTVTKPRVYLQWINTEKVEINTITTKELKMFTLDM